MMTRCLFLLCLFACCLHANADDRPNVLMIYFDDMGYGDMGANGVSGAKIPSDSKFLDPSRPTLTPNLDRFAESAMRFTNGHSADGVCSPSRYSLMTGRYSWRTSLKKGVTGGYSQTFLEADRFTIGKMFQKHGYKTAMVGKWHIGMQFYSPTGEPVNLGNKANVLKNSLIDFSKPVTDTPFHRGGFDYYFGTPASLDMPPYVWLESRGDNVHVLRKGGFVKNGDVVFGEASLATNEDLAEGKRFGRPGVNDPDFVFADYLQVQAAKVTEVIDQRKSDGAPFFIYVPMPAPHTPHTVQEKFDGSAGWTYGDYVVQTDFYTGQIIDALGDPNDSNSLASNTVVFVTSDNGPENGAYHTSLENNHDANGPWAGRKRDNYEGGTRVPFLVRWPGKVKPGTTEHACWQGDFVATMADVLGYQLGHDEAGDAESFLPILKGDGMPNERRLGFIQHSSKGQFAVVDALGEWKLIDGTGGGGNLRTCDSDNKETLGIGTVRGTPRQLFNLKNDPGERVNLLTTPTAEVLDKERKLYQLLNSIRGDSEWGSAVERNERRDSE